MPSPLPTLHHHPITLRPTQLSDAEPFLTMLAEPALTEWWGENTLVSIQEEMVGSFTILVEDEVAGLLECHEETEPSYPEVAFDIMLGSRFHGRGYGRLALRMAIDHYARIGHHRFTIDPAVENQAAVRCYSAVGFKPVGILRASERAPSGEWRDGLLMDLLAWELT